MADTQGSTSRLASLAGLSPAQQAAWARSRRVLAAVLLAWPVLLAAMALLTDWDLRLADAQFDFGLRQFPMRHAWLTEVFNHIILKRVLICLAVVLVAVALHDALAPRAWTALRRIQWRIAALSALLVPGAISGMKLLSWSHCPWDLQRYGGAEPYIGLFESPLPGMTPGHCMPAGHASSALWMTAFAVFYLPRHPARAAAVLVLFQGLGLLVGWLQQLRGAHFLTHTLWSMWAALTVVFLITVCMDSLGGASLKRGNDSSMFND